MLQILKEYSFHGKVSNGLICCIQLSGILQLGIYYTLMCIALKPFANGSLPLTQDILCHHYAYQAQLWRVFLASISALQEGN